MFLGRKRGNGKAVAVGTEYRMTQNAGIKTQTSRQGAVYRHDLSRAKH